MRKSGKAMQAAMLAFLAGSPSYAQTIMSSEVHTYLDRALDIMEQNSLNKTKVNWADLRAKAFTAAAGAQKIYAAVVKGSPGASVAPLEFGAATGAGPITGR
jgi:hypothetical protein